MTATTTARPAAVTHQHDTSRTRMMRSYVRTSCPTGAYTGNLAAGTETFSCLHEFSIGAFEREAAANGPNADRRRGSHDFGHDRRLRRRGRGVHPARNFLRVGCWGEPRRSGPSLLHPTNQEEGTMSAAAAFPKQSASRDGRSVEGNPAAGGSRAHRRRDRGPVRRQRRW